MIVGTVEADRVHITYDGGLGTVLLADLSPDLQKRFNCDPAKAKQAARDREAAQAAVDAEVAAEVAAQTQKQAAADAATARQAAYQSALSTTSQSRPAAKTVDPATAQRIAWLRQDIADMERQMFSDRQYDNNPNWSHGGLNDKIMAERHELSQLTGSPY